MYFKIITVTLLFSFSHLRAQEREPQIVPEKINDNLYLLYGGGGQGANVGLYIGADELLLVDAMKGSTAEKLLGVIRTISDKPIKYIISTHADDDHAGGNSFFMQRGAIVYMQENGQYEGGEGSVYFKGKLTIPFSGETIEVNPTVSHSFCDALIYFKGSNVVFMGDTFTNSWYATFNSGGVQGQFNAIDKALAIGNQNTVYLPGHGIPSNVEGLQTYRAASGDWSSKVAELYRNRIPVDEMVENEELNRIKDRFVDERTGATIPQARLKRFIERTISADLLPSFPLDSGSLSDYVGVFQYADGTSEEIYSSGGKLFIRKIIPYQYVAELLPQSEHLFHLRAGINMWLEFNTDKSGFEFRYGDESVSARKSVH